MTNNRTNQAAEAVSSGLYREGWEHLGDTDAGQTTWFTHGENDKKVRLRIERSNIADNLVFVRMEYLNQSVRPARIMEVEYMIDTNESDMAVLENSTVCVVRVQQWFKDVLAGTGIAGVPDPASLDGAEGTGGD